MSRLHSFHWINVKNWLKLNYVPKCDEIHITITSNQIINTQMSFHFQNFFSFERRNENLQCSVFSHFPDDMTLKYSTAAYLMNKVGNCVCSIKRFSQNEIGKLHLMNIKQLHNFRVQIKPIVCWLYVILLNVWKFY